MPLPTDPTGSIDWATATNQALDQSQAEQLRGSLAQALPVNPDQEAATRKIAAAAQVPVQTARADPQGIARQAQVQNFDTQSLQQQAPHLAQWLTNPDNASISHDAIPQGVAVEKAVQSVKAASAPAPAAPGANTSPTSTLGSIADYIMGAGKAHGLFGDVAEGALLGTASSGNRALTAVNTVAGALPVILDSLKNLAPGSSGSTPLSDWWFKNMVDPVVANQAGLEAAPNAPFALKAAHAAFGMVQTMAQMIATGGAGEAAPALEGAELAATSGAKVASAAVEHGTKSMAFPALTAAVNQGRETFDATHDPIAAIKAATAQWLGNSMMGAVPLSVGGNLATRVATGAVSGMASGEMTREGTNLALPDSEKTPFDWETNWLNALTGSLLAGTMGPRAGPDASRMQAAVRDTYSQEYQAAKAEASNDSLVELAKAAAADPTRERDAAAFKQKVADAVGPDHQGIFIDAQTFAQAMQDHDIKPAELRETMPTVADQLDSALGENAPKNGMISIPVEDFATHIVGSPLQDALLPHMRLDPESPSVEETQAYRKTQNDEMQASADKLSAQNLTDENYKASLTQVSTDLQSRLEATGMPPEQASANLAPLLAFHQVQADRLGILPHEFAEKYPVNFANKATDGFEQAPAGEAKGTYSPTTKTIAQLKGADLSTFQHELGHYFLDTLTHIAARDDAPAGVKGDADTLMKWGGVPGLDAWHKMSIDEQRELHEKFATGWETYLMKGQAPSLEMRGLFQRFRSWMVSVYKSMKGAPGDFTPEVKGVYDRLIASEDQIAEAERARGYMALFDSPEKAGMTPEEWTEYQKTGQDATQQAVEKLTTKTMSDMAWMDRLRTASLKSVQRDAAEKRKAIMREVRPEVLAQPVYRAWSFLTGRDTTALPDELNAEHVQATRVWTEKRAEHQTETAAAIRTKAWEASPESQDPAKNGGLDKGQWLAKNRAPIDADIDKAMAEWDKANRKPVAPVKPEGSKDPTSGAGKLNTAAIKDQFGPDIAKKLADNRMVNAKGMDPGMVADMFGFKDGDDLIQALTTAEHPRDVTNAITDQRMLERHGELIDADAVQRTADQLVQNEIRARFVATELRALKKGSGPVKEIVAAAKEVAANTIDSKRIRDISDRLYSAAATRSAALAEKGMSKGDTAGAAAAKRDQLLNMELARAARDATDYVKKSLDYLAKFDKASVRENIHVDYRDQIDALLDRADLRKSVSNAALDKRASLEAFVERMAAQGYKPGIPDSLLDETQRWHYKDMPLQAFRGLVDSVKSIESLGKLKQTLLDGKEQRDLNEVAREAADSAGKLPQRSPEGNRGLTRMAQKWMDTKAFGRSIQASLLKMEQMFDWLDARNPNGAFNRIFRRIADAGVAKNDRMVQIKAGFDELMGKHLEDITREKKAYAADGLVDSKTGEPVKLTTKEMLMLAGHYGNDSNWGKVLKGEGWDPEKAQAFLMKNMTQAHWDYVAGVGRILESMWPDKLAMERRLGNTAPPKIEPRPFDTPHGRYEGWYWPMTYDPARDQAVADRAAKKGAEMFENTFSTASTATGRMNTRNENYARPVLLDLDALPRIIADEVHDLSYREAVIDADKFLTHPLVRKAIVDSLSQEHYDQINPWLISIANDGRTSTEGMRAMIWMNKVAAEARTRATMVGLGFRLTTALVHGSSAGVESIAELGPKWFGSGLKDFMNPGQWAANKAFVFERSGEMRHRANEFDRDIREHLDKINLALMDPASSAMTRGADMTRGHAYSMIGGLDMMSALPTWMGAYKKALSPVAQGGLAFGENDAVHYADKTVRNAHGGGGVKDMAAVQRGPEFQKLFTMFYTFWNHNVNRLMDTAKLVGSSEHRAMMKETNGWSDSHVAATVILRTLVYTIGVQALHSLLQPPKKDADSESWLKWAAKEFADSALAGTPIARDIAASALTGRDYAATPAASVVTSVGKTGVDSLNALQGKKVSSMWLKHALTTAGVLTNLPIGQAGATAQFLYDVEQGNVHPNSVKEWWNGALHGDIHAH